MSDLNSDYWNPLDKEALAKYEISPKQVGISHGAGDLLQGLKANVFAGANQVELGFMGAGKGSRSSPTSHTPEVYGMEERKAMRNMAKINDVTLSTHATVGVGNLSGLGERGFSQEQREKSLTEVKRAVDFAADVAEGGPVTIHTGEFPRSIQEKFGKEGFKEYEGEEKTKTHYLVDEKTGQITKAVREDEVVFLAKPDPENPDKLLFNPKTKEFVVDKTTFADYKEKYQKDNPGKSTAEVAKAFLNDMQQAEIGYAEGFSHQHELEHHAAKERKSELDKALKIYEENKAGKTKEQLEHLKRQVLSTAGIDDPRRLGDQDTIEFLNEQINTVQEKVISTEKMAISQKKQALRLKEQIENTVSIEEYGLEKSAHTIARAAIYAYDREKAQNLEKPLFIAPENIFPEGGYGSHPDELKNIILESRKSMTKQLQEQRKIPEKQAKKIADEHIKATFDVGHAYTWKKFFERNEGESQAQAEQRFEKWLLKKVDSLAKEGIIGHVHISDNFGYYDEHVTPGEGKVPFKKVMAQMKEAGYDGPVIAEIGGQSEGQMYKAMTGAWRALNSPLYRIDAHSTAWTDVEHSYFGRTGSPTYIVGDLAPSKDWSFWSETPME